MLAPVTSMTKVLAVLIESYQGHTGGNMNIAHVKNNRIVMCNNPRGNTCVTLTM